MRFIVYGAGAIGGVVGARLAQAGRDVALVARGAHLEAIRSNGLSVEDPDGAERCELRAAATVAELRPSTDDVVLLAMKAQDTEAALLSLAPVAPPELAVACFQNGVENERAAARFFANVYGVCVMCPAEHVEPGVVVAQSSPTTGLLDLGRYPTGTDSVADEIAAAFRDATYAAEAREDVMRWKYRKLLMNLGNAVEAICARGSGR